MAPLLPAVFPLIIGTFSLCRFFSFSHPSISMLSLSPISLHLFSYSESIHMLCLSSFQLKQLNPQINVLFILSNAGNLFFMHLFEPFDGARKGCWMLRAMQKRKKEWESHLLWRARNIIGVQFKNRAVRKLLVLSLLLLFSCLRCLREWCDTHFKLWIVAYHATIEELHGHTCK